MKDPNSVTQAQRDQRDRAEFEAATDEFFGMLLDKYEAGEISLNEVDPYFPREDVKGKPQ